MLTWRENQTFLKRRKAATCHSSAATWSWTPPASRSAMKGVRITALCSSNWSKQRLLHPSAITQRSTGAHCADIMMRASCLFRATLT
jgi:hypothetical protein